MQTTLQAQIELSEAALKIDDEAFSSFAGFGSDNNSVPQNADVSGLDPTTGLGAVTVTITSSGAHYVGMFFDLNIDTPDNTFFNENGSASGSPALGQSWEIDEPELGNIYSNTQNKTLDNSNGVPSGSEDDVSMALAWDFNLNSSETAVIEFTVSESAPAEGFYLIHTDPGSGKSVYFSSTLTVGPTIPAFSSIQLVCLVGLMMGIAVFQLRKKR